MMSRMQSGPPLQPAEWPVITLRAIAVYLLLAFMAFAPAFFPWQQIAGTDYVTGGFYFLEYAARARQGGHFPTWVPYIFGGVPMYANPGSLFYPARMLFIEILPLERVMPALYVVQFALAGIGMHLFARTLGVRPWVAFLGGLLYEFTGVTFSYVYAGHDGRIIGATLAPFLFYFVTVAVRTGRASWFAGIAASVGLMLLSFQLQSTYYVLLGAGAWAVFLLARARAGMPTPVLVRRAVLGGAAVAFGFMLAAVNLLPFSGYVEDSPRSSVAKRDYAFSTQFSMPVVETVGLAVPEQAGLLEEYKGDNPFKLHTEYVGAIVLLLLVVGAMSFQRDAVWQFMAGLALFMLTVCYGSYTPLYSLYYRVLPGTTKFRSPSIALFMVSFALVVMAVLTLESMADALDERPASRGFVLPRRLLTALIGASVLIVTVALGTALDGGHRALGWARFGVCLLLASLIVRTWIFGRIRVRTASILLSVLAVADLWVVDRNFLWTQPVSDIVYAADDVVHFLKSMPDARVWVFPFPNAAGAEHYMGNKRFPPNSDYLMHFGIRQAGGEHGNQPFRWNRLAGIGTTGNVDWHNFVEYPAILGAAGVKYIVSAVSLSMVKGKSRMGMKGLRELYHGSAYVYENESAVPRATLVPSAVSVSSPQVAVIAMRNADWDARRVAVVEGALPELADTSAAGMSAASTVRMVVDEPEHVAIHVDAERPALLVLSDNYVEGWTARVDGSTVPILRTNLAFRGVPVSKGSHDVVFEFAPRRLYAGMWMSSVGWTVLLISVAGLVFTGRRREPAIG
ncbi:MAG: putative rane protein [Gemmatimonadetes bacterium]|nr:putative rane protein [Gemmatimonadota bacterium]